MCVYVRMYVRVYWLLRGGVLLLKGPQQKEQENPSLTA